LVVRVVGGCIHLFFNDPKKSATFQNGFVCFREYRPPPQPKMNPTQTTQQIKMDSYQKWLNGESFCECGEKACGTYGPDNKELCEECRDDEGWCSCGNKEEECDVCGEDDWEECEDCGYTHHYEDKCPVGEQCKMYEKKE